MRKILDKIYLLSGYLSAVFLALIALTIIAQILGWLAFDYFNDKTIVLIIAS